MKALTTDTCHGFCSLHGAAHALTIDERAEQLRHQRANAEPHGRPGGRRSCRNTRFESAQSAVLAGLETKWRTGVPWTAADQLDHTEIARRIIRPSDEPIRPSADQLRLLGKANSLKATAAPPLFRRAVDRSDGHVAPPRANEGVH